MIQLKLMFFRKFFLDKIVIHCSLFILRLCSSGTKRNFYYSEAFILLIMSTQFAICEISFKIAKDNQPYLD